VTSQCPSRAPSRKGTSVGGVSERAGAKAGGSNPFGMKNPSRGVAVEGILVFRKAAPFAGCRQNAGLGRSVASCGYPPVGAGAPMTADVRRTPRRGTPSACATYAHAPSTGTRDRCMRSGDASFARSFDPCTLILTMLRGESLGGEAFESASRLGKLGQPRGTNTGAGTGERSAARRVSPIPQGRGRDTSKKRKEIEVSVPARIERARVWLPARRKRSCRSR
jgi:hypothetical protein